jgi:hypothetical protein
MLLARIASRANRFGDAHALFDEARDALLSVGAEGELLIADAYRAECLAFEGRHADAVHAVDDVLARAPARGEHSLAPLLLRVTGIAAAQRGDIEGAFAAFDGSCVAARNLAADHEVALTLDVVVQLGELDGSDTAEARRERDEIFARLDVQWTPDVPLAPSPAVAVPSAP